MSFFSGFSQESEVSGSLTFSIYFNSSLKDEGSGSINNLYVITTGPSVLILIIFKADRIDFSSASGKGIFKCAARWLLSWHNFDIMFHIKGNWSSFTFFLSQAVKEC